MTRSSFTSLAVAAAISCAGGIASAQSTSTPVTFSPLLFGVMDVNARTVHNGSSGTFRSESTDGLSSSRIGFRGNEDLGDGLKANFWLEAGIAPDTGTTNAKFFNRRSTVSLIDPTLGEIRLGRDYTPLFTAYAVYDPFGTNGLGEIIGSAVAGGTGIISSLGSGSNTITRADNQISYLTPNTLGGVYAQLAVAPSEGTPGNRYVGGRLGYNTKPFDASFGYEQTTVIAGDKFKQFHVGAYYDFDVAKISGQFLQSRYASTLGGSRKQLVYQIGASVPVGHGQFRADFIYGNMSGGAAGSGYGDADDAKQITVGYLYNFSKRTAVYVDLAQLRNSGASRLVVATGYAGMLGGQNSNGADIGIRHMF